MALGIIAGAVSVGSGIVKGQEQARIESHIQDRVAKYQNMPDIQLQQIINQYGGEMGEAAQRVLNMRAQNPGASRGSAPVSPFPASAPPDSSDASPSGQFGNALGSPTVLVVVGLVVVGAAILLWRK